MFRQQTSSETLKSVTCAARAESRLASECSEVNVDDLDLAVLCRPDRRLRKNSGNDNDVVDFKWLDSEVTAPALPSPIPLMEDVILDPAGIRYDSNLSDVHLTLCKSCKSSITSGCVPALSLANHMVLGETPAQLKDLTIVEEAMIAKCRAKCWIVQLKEENAEIGSSPSAQHAVKGHVIILSCDIFTMPHSRLLLF